MKRGTDFASLAVAVLRQADGLLAQWLPGGVVRGHEYVCASVAGGAGRSLSVNLKTGQWADFSADLKGGDLISLYSAIHGLNNGQAARELAAQLGFDSSIPAPPPGPTPGQPAAKRKSMWRPVVPVPEHAPPPDFKHWHYAAPHSTWAYRRDGVLYGHVVRFTTSDGGKEVLPLTWCVDEGDDRGTMRWHWKQWEEPRPLYLAAGALRGWPVVLVEGEKCAQAGHALLGDAFDFVSWPGGSKAWSKCDWSWLAGATVMLWPDADSKRVPLTAAEREAGTDPESRPYLPTRKQPGMAAMVGIGTILQATQRCSVTLCPIPAPGQVADGWDIADAIAEGWDAARVRAFLESAKPFVVDDDAAARDAGQRRENSPSPGDTSTADHEPRDRFKLDDRGVWHFETDQEGNSKKPHFVCSPLRAISRVRDVSGKSWGLELEFTDPGGTIRRWVMLARLLASDGAELRAALLDQGVVIPSNSKSRNLLPVYLQTRQVDAFARTVTRIGWHAGAFVTPTETLQRADAAERIVLQSEGAPDNHLVQKGTCASWRTIANLARGNSRLVFGIALAFAAPLLRASRIDSGGFHFRGSSSTGKTTILRVASSVFGAPDTFMQRWRATDNSLENLAAVYCDLLLALDELSQLDPRVAGDAAFLLANETSKARSSKTGAPRPRQTWKLLFISSGEVSLATHMASAGKQIRAGQEARIADIPAEVEDGSVFEELHGHVGSGDFAERLESLTARHHGVVGHVWLQWLVENASRLARLVGERIEALTEEFATQDFAGQARRVARRFALVALGGELATEVGLTGWNTGEATKAARKCFSDWLAGRPGGAGNTEMAAMLGQVRRWFALNGAGRFTYWHRAVDDRSPDKGLRAGFKRLIGPTGRDIQDDSAHVAEYGLHAPSETAAEGTTTTYFCFPEVFDSEICQGFDPLAVRRLLRDRGFLAPDRGRPFDCTPRIPGLGPTRCYRILPTIFAGDD